MASEYPSVTGDMGDLPGGPPGGRRAQAIQRVQVGLFGLAAMILLVGLANIIMDRAQETESRNVPETAASVAAQPSPAPQSDPLADAGVVPDLPSARAPAQAAKPGAQRTGDNGGSAAQP